jgi:hypothetical protein
MPDSEPRPDPDEKFSLHPEEGEEVLRKLLGAEEGETTESAEVVAENEENDP